MFRAGDQVKHGPTGECWLLAFGDTEDGTGKVSPCGWQETLAEASDCTLLKAATDDEADEMRRKWSDMRVAGMDIRKSICRTYLMAADQPTRKQDV